MTTRNFVPDQWRNRGEWCLVSGRRRQLLKNQMNGWMDGWVDGWMDGWMDRSVKLRRYGNISVVWLHIYWCVCVQCTVQSLNL